MTEVDFSPAREWEEPLYLDSVTPRPPNRFRSERTAGASGDVDRPLHLDAVAREPGSEWRGLPLVSACAATFLLSAAGGALLLGSPVLGSPAALRDRLASVTALSAPGHVPSPATPSAFGAPQASAAPAEAPSKAPPAATGAPRRSRTTVAERPIHHAKSARLQRAPKAPLDLDALAKSLN
jgi:hypothetical protein